MEHNGKGQNGKGFGPEVVMVAYLAGGIVGAGLALLWAPQSGKETRRLIRDRTGQFVKRSEELFGQARTKGTEWIGQGKRFVGDQKEIVAAGFEAAMKKSKRAGLGVQEREEE